jgi:hypothetical protein
VCTRPVPVSGYSATGQVLGTLDTSTNDIVICVVLGSNGQVLLKGDTVDATLIYDSETCRIGYLEPGDSSMSCDASDEDVLSGYWYQPPAYYTQTTTTVLVSEGYWKTTTIVNTIVGYYTGSVFVPNPPPGYTVYNYTEYKNGVFYANVQSLTYKGTSYSSSWNTYVQTWIPPVYETQTSGYWTYPDPVWVETGNPGEISCIYISVADTQIGSVYVTRPLCC